jgi:hypothetical protein
MAWRQSWSKRANARAVLFFFFSFNLCFSLATAPTQWLISHADFLLYKGKGDPMDPSSYRYISLLSVFSKVYEQILYFRLLNWAGSNGTLSDNQFGFRKKRSTLDLVFIFRQLLKKYVFSRGVPIYLVFIDMERAFPSVKMYLLFPH